jgi:hypothetical protein
MLFLGFDLETPPLDVDPSLSTTDCLDNSPNSLKHTLDSVRRGMEHYHVASVGVGYDKSGILYVQTEIWPRSQPRPG